MVFSGKPSTACHACRARRLKCDRAHPSCGQCLRKSKQCGYRDASTLRLRNETSRVAFKYDQSRSSTTPSPASSATATPSSAATDPSPAEDVVPTKDANTCQDVAFPIKGSPLSTLRQPEELLAMGYFMSSYVVSTPFENYLPILCQSNTDQDDAFTAALSATAMAAYARRVRSPKDMNTARQRYSTALAHTNASLAKDVRAVNDRIIAAVLLLGFYEAVVFQGGESVSPTSWTTHTFGALELFRLRGLEGVKSPVAQHLFAQASNNVKTSCIQMSVEIPPKLLKFCDDAAPLLDPQNPSVQIGPLIHRVAYFKAQTIKRLPTYDMLLEARQMDEELVAFGERLPKELRYYVLPKAETPSWAFNGLAHSYSDLRAVKIWNALRLLRIFLLTYIGAAVAGELGVDREELAAAAGLQANNQYLGALAQYATNQMVDVAAQIMACVSAFIHVDDHGRRFSPAARCLAWPMCIIKHIRICPKPYRDYATKCLQDIASELNLPKALDATIDPDKYEDWMHLFHLG